MQTLRVHVLAAVNEDSAERDDTHEVLLAKHKQAEQSLRDEISKVSAKFHKETGRGTAGAKGLRLQNRMADLHFRLIIMPLDAQTVSDLLSISRDDAYARISRYRKELPELLPEELNRLDQHLKSMREDHQSQRRKSSRKES